ncbi:MAG: dockerin type I repeat-containing protein [Muribaculaceae bacterium]|nr:dockerin type I repeat-containing protein [Muribaculaceae bacterium]
MKKIVLLLVALLSFGIMQADEYVPLLREGVKWVCVETKSVTDYNHPEFYPDVYTRFYTIELIGDTVVEGMTYKKCYRYSDVDWNETLTFPCSRTEPIALLREEGRVVYAYNRDDYFYTSSGSMTDFLYWSTYDWYYDGEKDMKLYEFDENGHFKLEGYKPFLNQESEVYSYIHPYLGAEQGLFIEGVGFDSDIFGDLLMPYYERALFASNYRYLGLHHIEDADGNIIYYGKAYRSDNANGDIDGSGMVDVEDVNAAINIILKLKTVGDYPGNGDMDGNGIIDVEDVNAIINIILKL